MNLLNLGPALERMVDAVDAPAIQVDADACVRRWNRESGCQRCAGGCPVQAITLASAGEATSLVALDAEACVQCGYCLHVCPSGVFSGRDETARLLQTVTALLPCQSVEIHCLYAPRAEAEPQVEAIVELGGCLAALGAAAYVGLAALGVERISVRTEACASCPIGSLAAAIEESVGAAAALTSAPITIQDSDSPAAVARPVYATYTQRVSRRSLWRRLGGGEQAPVSPLPAQEEPPPGKHPPAERRTLLHTLAYLPEEKRASAPAFPTMTADATCTACGVCANVCPTGALVFALDENTFTLQLAPLACTECGLCMELCPSDALRPAGSIAYAAAYPAVLITGSHKQCRRCRAPFAGAGELCPACDFRRKNPAGSRVRRQQP